MDDMNEPPKFEERHTLKLSEAIRVCGYGDVYCYNQCALGRAYKLVTGRSLLAFGRGKDMDVEVTEAARVFGVPVAIAGEVETRCFDSEPPIKIATWLEAQGL